MTFYKIYKFFEIIFVIPIISCMNLQVYKMYFLKSMLGYDESSGELVVSGWGSRTVEIPSNKTFIDRARKVKYSEYLYVAEVLSGNGDAFVSLTVEDEDEFEQTVACSRSGESEVLYTSLNTGYGTKHWLIPGFLQGIPS